MVFSGSLLQIDSIILQLFQCVRVHLVGHPERLGSCHLAVREEIALNSIFLLRFTKFGGPVRSNGNELKAQLIQLWFNALQFTELPVAVRSPTATIEDNYGRSFPDHISKVHFGIINRPQSDHRHRQPWHQWANFSGRRRYGPWLPDQSISSYTKN
jgi:hypothetical protein